MPTGGPAQLLPDTIRYDAGELLKPFEYRSVSRSALGPCFSTIPEEDFTARWYKLSKEGRVRTGKGDPSGSPQSRVLEEFADVEVPHFTTNIQYSRFQLPRLAKSRASRQERANLILNDFPEYEDAIVFCGVNSGKTGDVGIGSATKHTTADTELDLTTIITASTTLTSLFGQLRDGKGASSAPKGIKSAMVAANPAALFVTPDVGDRIDGHIDANTSRTMRDVIMGILLAKSPHPLTGIYPTELLGATVNFKDSDQYSVDTAGTTNAALASVNKEFIEIFTTNVIQYGGPTPEGHVKAEYLLRSTLKGKLTDAIVYSGTVDITS